jgi:hypothetical protein
MKKLIHHAAMALALAAVSVSALAGVKVTFAPPEKMTDVPRDKPDRESMEFLFTEHLNKLASQLPAGQELKVEFTDIDLAGDVFPRVAVQNIRVMKGRADWPRLKIRYSVEQDGKVLRSGERELKDMNYQMSYHGFRNDIYGYEKQLLDDWFKKDVLAAR